MKSREGVWFIALVVGTGLAMRVCAQTTLHPEWKIGDTWTYHQRSGLPTVESDWSREVVESISEGRYGVHNEIGGNLTFDGEGNSLDKRGPDYSWRRFNFPLSVGKQWTHERKIADGTGTGNEKSSWEVKAYEKLTVPAGTFDCFRVEGVALQSRNSATLGQSANKAQIDTTYWYCPEVKWVAKWKFRSHENETAPYVDVEAVLTSFTTGTTLARDGQNTPSAEGIQRPVWSVNDTWTYKRTVGPITWNPAETRYQQKFTIVELRGSQYRADVATIPVRGTGSEQTSTANWGISSALNSYYRENAELPYTELRFLQWPLTIGKSWTFEHPMADGRPFLWHVKVDRWEDVAVPAGRFKAVVIEIDGQAKGGDAYLQKRTMWFAPDTKSKVKEIWYGLWRSSIINHEVYELENYKVL